MTGTRTFTRTQTLENAAFLAQLRRTGNAREAARALGAHRAKFTRRRARDPAFAARWDAALALAHAALDVKNPCPGPPTAPHLVRMANGRLQLRRALPGRVDAAARQRFLAALSASANVRLAAKAAGFSHAAFYQPQARRPGLCARMAAGAATRLRPA